MCTTGEGDVDAALSAREEQPGTLRIRTDDTREAATHLIHRQAGRNACPRLTEIVRAIEVRRVVAAALLTDGDIRAAPVRRGCIDGDDVPGRRIPRRRDRHIPPGLAVLAR